MAELHGLRAGTFESLMFGPGKGYTHIDLTPLFDPDEADPVNAALATAHAFGATRGGMSFAVEPEMRQIELDGMRGAYKGSQRKDSESATLTVNLAEQTIKNLLMQIPGAVMEDLGNGLYHITGGELNDESYVPTIGFTCTHGVGGREYPAFIIIENALNTEGFEISLEDKDEGVSETTFMAHYNTATADTPPWHIFIAALPGELETLIPTFTALSPDTGAAGSQFQVQGTNLTGVETVQFDGVTIPIAARTPTLLTVTAPAAKAPGTYPVTLVHQSGTVSAGTFTIS